MTKLDPKIFLKAAGSLCVIAERNDDHDPYRFACTQIMRASRQEQLGHNPYCTYFSGIFKPHADLPPGSFWWDRLADNSFDFESRILALLLAAETLRNP